MGRGNSAYNGGSFANGSDTPAWARDWQFRQLWESRVTIWEFME